VGIHPPASEVLFTNFSAVTVRLAVINRELLYDAIAKETVGSSVGCTQGESGRFS
jgi:hypothetical protein